MKIVSLVRAFIVQTLSEFALKPEISNNSMKEIRILNNSRRDESIITKGDKDKTLVVMDTKNYVSKLNA